MQELLPYYERELAFLRGSSREFAKRYPKVAAGLGLTSEVCEDPHVEQMIESFALLTARISKKLDDDYPELTEALFNVIYPHYLRSFPSCSIAQFKIDPEKLTVRQTLKRGSVLKSHVIKGVACKFRTVYDVQALPLLLSQVRYHPSSSAPGHVQIRSQVTARLTLTLQLAKKESLKLITETDRLRLYLHGDVSLVAILRDALLMHTAQVFVENGTQHRWTELPTTIVQPCGYDEQESLIDFPAASHPAYRLLTEYFAFTEKFHFVDLELGSLLPLLADGEAIKLHFMVESIAADTNQSRLLETVSLSNVRTGCTPVINLFEKKADPIRLTHREVSYPVVADARRAHAYEIYSINRVCQVKQTPQGDSIVNFQPFYALHHGDTPATTPGYWIAKRNTMLAQTSPGYETEITLVDLSSNPTIPQIETLSIDLTCSNRNLASQLAIGQLGGDLMLEGGGVAQEIRLLRRPSRSMRFAQGKEAHWRLVSHLSLNHLSLVKGGLASLKETLKLYDLADSAISVSQIEGLVDLDHKPITLWMPGEPFASFVRGIEILLTIDTENYIGTSLHGFIQILNRFFAMYVHVNSFIQLVVLAKNNNQEIMRCAPCNGESILA